MYVVSSRSRTNLEFPFLLVNHILDDTEGAVDKAEHQNQRQLLLDHQHKVVVQIRRIRKSFHFQFDIVQARFVRFRFVGCSIQLSDDRHVDVVLEGEESFSPVSYGERRLSFKTEIRHIQIYKQYDRFQYFGCNLKHCLQYHLLTSII